MGNEKQREISHEDLQKVMSSIDIPACPVVVTQAMAEAQKDDPDINRLSDLIAKDPGMSAAALKLANSALYSASAQVTGIRKAIDRLGTKNVVCVIVASALRASIAGLPAAWLDKFWKQVGQLAVAAALVAKRQYGISQDAATTYALFHDAGIPLMLKRFPKYEQALQATREQGMLLIDAEDQYFPCTHPIVGMLLVRNWGLPPILGQAIRFHHDPEAYDLTDATLPGGALSLIAVSHVAERLAADVRGHTDFEVGDHLYRRALDHLGITDDELDELRQRVAMALEAEA